MNNTDTSLCRQVISAICPAPFDPRHFATLCQLDGRLRRLAHEIETGNPPTRMPGYWLAWKSIERRLADIVRHPRHPFLRTTYAVNCAHHELRRLYWESGILEAAS